MYFDDLIPSVKPTDLLSEDSERVHAIVKTFKQLPNTDTMWPFSFTNTAADIVKDGDTMIDEAILKIIYGQQDINTWDTVVANYMKMQGDVFCKVATEQWNKNFKSINPYATLK
jgi:hypothetical protein